MAEANIRPEDVSTVDARKVLAFLNAAQTAEQIAETVEFIDERDVGIRVAQRLLERRQELGTFMNLQQVAEVPQVGPERFTEIVTALSGLESSRRTDATALQPQLLQEIRELRKTVKVLRSALDTRHRVTLRPLQDQPFLGQPITIVATVTDVQGTTPRVGTPVTFAATWGVLRSAGDLTVQQGNTVTARTSADGTAKVTLLPPTSEDLSAPQQAALETVLRSLDTDAPTPRETESGLQEMVQHYRWEANVDFRRAVDIYFRDFRHQLLDTINYHDYMRTWSYFDATVLVFVREDTNGDTPNTSVQGTAALTMHFKDWLGPWLETYLVLSESESTLGDDLKNAKQQNEEAGVLVQDVYGHVRDFVTGQRGLVGEYAGRKIAETSLGKFLDSELDDLPLDTRVALFPALRVAANTIDTSDVNVLTAVGQTRADLRQELGTKIGKVETETINVLTAHVDSLQEQLNGKADETDLSGLQVEVNNQLAAKADRTTLDEVVDQAQTELRQEVNSKLAQKVDVATFSDQVDQLDAKIAGVVAERIDTLARSVEELSTKITEVETESIEVLTTRVENIQVQLDGKVDVATFNDAMETKVDAVEFDSFKTEVSSELTTKVDAAAFDAALATKADETDLNNLQIEVNNKVDAGAFDQALAQKVDATAFNTALASKVDSTTFTTRLNTLQGKVSTLESEALGDNPSA